MTMRLVPYEQQRAERIKRNTEIMIQMGVLTAAQALDEAVLKSKGSRPIARRAYVRTVTRTEVEGDNKPQRRSSRLKGKAPAVLPHSETTDYRHTLLTAYAPYIREECPAAHRDVCVAHVACVTCPCIATGLGQAPLLVQRQPRMVSCLPSLTSTTSSASGPCR